MQRETGNSDEAGAPKLAAGQRPTLKTIAFMTGLGITTVSKALKDAPDIGEATKKRVRLVADQIGYRPNRAGVRLRTGKTNVI
ncbi:MAG: LacI family DNA-binding transcriptional regulator, partial [Roseibium sp.]